FGRISLFRQLQSLAEVVFQVFFALLDELGVARFARAVVLGADGQPGVGGIVSAQRQRRLEARAQVAVHLPDALGRQHPEDLFLRILQIADVALVRIRSVRLAAIFRSQQLTPEQNKSNDQPAADKDQEANHDERRPTLLRRPAKAVRRQRRDDAVARKWRCQAGWSRRFHQKIGLNNRRRRSRRNRTG